MYVLNTFVIFFFFFNDTATTEIYTPSLHYPLPISSPSYLISPSARSGGESARWRRRRSEEHTSELQSHVKLLCRLLLEKKKKKIRREPVVTWKAKLKSAAESSPVD